jgi:hypothetical protein
MEYAERTRRASRARPRLTAVDSVSTRAASRRARRRTPPLTPSTDRSTTRATARVVRARLRPAAPARAEDGRFGPAPTIARTVARPPSSPTEPVDHPRRWLALVARRRSRRRPQPDNAPRTVERRSEPRSRRSRSPSAACPSPALKIDAYSAVFGARLQTAEGRIARRGRERVRDCKPAFAKIN